MESILTVVLLTLCACGAGEPVPKLYQFPSPMVEHTRSHARLKEERPRGQREQLRIGTLFLPERLPNVPVPLVIHFHGGARIPEFAATKVSAAVVAVQLGAGSSAYAKPFGNPTAFADLIADAESKSGRKFETVGLTAWSAGYGAVRAILNVPEHYDRVQFILLLDGLHCGYLGGKPGPKESKLVTEDLAIFLKYARDAAAGKKQMRVTHTEIFPGTFASTTETADFLLREMDLKRRPVLRWGPMGTQILCEVKKGRFHLLGFAGNSAPDHVDQLHALPELLGELDLKRHD